MARKSSHRDPDDHLEPDSPIGRMLLTQLAADERTLIEAAAQLRFEQARLAMLTKRRAATAEAIEAITGQPLAEVLAAHAAQATG